MTARLLTLVAPYTAGDPMTSTRWLNCRLRDVQDHLAEAGHAGSLPVISRLLQHAGYRLRGNRKHLTAHPHPDRDTQFRYLRAQRATHLQATLPVISVDTKKKELIGDFKNAGRIWHQDAEAVLDHDFPSDAAGRAVEDTTTSTGLQVETQRVLTVYPTGVKVSDDEMELLNIQAHEVCPSWNYTIHPCLCYGPA